MVVSSMGRYSPSGRLLRTNPPGCVERSRGTSSKDRSAWSSARPFGNAMSTPHSAAMPASSASAASPGSRPRSRLLSVNAVSAGQPSARMQSWMAVGAWKTCVTAVMAAWARP